LTTLTSACVSLSENVQRLLRDQTPESPLEQAFREQLKPWLQGRRADPIRPLHWPLEFPEVMAKGGFHAIVSNPPFIGGKRLAARWAPTTANTSSNESPGAIPAMPTFAPTSCSAIYPSPDVVE
jgi:hypothetical protein